MTFDQAVDVLRGWRGRPVVVVLEPDGSVMEGALRELDAGGVDGAMFALSPTGVAIALFRDAFAHARIEDGLLRIAQGRVEILVSPKTGTGAPTPGR